MAEINDISKSKQIRNLLLLIGSAVVVSFVVMFFMLYSYGQEGRYLAKNAMLSPESIKTLYFNDPHIKSGANSHFVFDLIEFSYYDETQKKIKKTKIDITNYAKLYGLIGDDVNLTNTAAEKDMFFNPVAANLYFKVRTENNTSQESSKSLFEIVFIKDYYRISLRGQSSDTQWVLFKHPAILEQVLELFTSNDNNES